MFHGAQVMSLKAGGRRGRKLWILQGEGGTNRPPIWCVFLVSQGQLLLFEAGCIGAKAAEPVHVFLPALHFGLAFPNWFSFDGEMWRVMLAPAPCQIAVAQRLADSACRPPLRAQGMGAPEVPRFCQVAG